MKMRSSILFAIALAVAARCPATPDVMARDQMIEIANEHQRLQWYCYSYNIYTTANIPNSICPYSAPGPQTGLAYKWGGYDTRDSFWTNVVVNHGWAGEGSSAAGIISNVYGDDCSGFASRVWRSGHYTTDSFPTVSSQVDYNHIAPGDLMDLSGSHCRLFEKFTGTNLIQEFECTMGVTPGRVTHRVLSTDTNYVPYRYNYAVAWPSIVRVTASGSTSAAIEFLGSATTGYRVYRSTDAATWTKIADESTLGVLAQSATATGLANATTYYFKVTAVNGTVETPASAVFPLRIASGARKALIVSAYDRWTRKTESGGLPYTFLTRYAAALQGAGYAFDTVDNLRIIDQTVALGNYGSVWWMLGDESTADESFSYQEQLRVQDYLNAGGKIFASGSEILYDIVSKAGPINDTPFAANYLKAAYSSDGASGNGYTFTGVAGTPFAGVSGGFDNGTGGTFNVQYPDIMTTVAGAKAVLTYGTGGTAAVLYTGLFPTGTTPGAIFLSGIPLETVTTAAARQALVNSATTAFFATTGISDWPQF